MRMSPGARAIRSLRPGTPRSRRCRPWPGPRTERVEGVALYQDPGSADVTADVNFSDLLKWGVAAGLRNVALESQGDFLSRYSRGRSEVDARLADPAGVGGAFLCLQQRPA